MQWWRDDLSLLPLIAAYGLASILFVLVLRRPAPTTRRFDNAAVRGLETAVKEVWGLFVDDGAVAVLAVVVLFGITWYVEHFTNQRASAAVLLVAGVLATVGIGLSVPSDKAERRRRPGCLRRHARGRPESDDSSALVPEETVTH